MRFTLITNSGNVKLSPTNINSIIIRLRVFRVRSSRLTKHGSTRVLPLVDTKKWNKTLNWVRDWNKIWNS